MHHFCFKTKVLSGGLRVIHLLDLISLVLTKSRRATRVCFVPSTDLFFPNPRRAVITFSPLKEGLGGCVD